MGVDVYVITKHNLDLSQPEKIVDYFHNQFQIKFTGKHFEKYRTQGEQSNPKEYYEVISKFKFSPSVTNEFRKEAKGKSGPINYETAPRYADPVTQFHQAGYLSFLGDFDMSLKINESTVYFEPSFRYKVYFFEKWGNEINEAVKSLISQIGGGTEVVIMPDSLNIAGFFLGGGKDPYEVDEKLSSEEKKKYVTEKYTHRKKIREMYSKLYDFTGNFDEIKQWLLESFGEPCYTIEEAVKKWEEGYIIKKNSNYLP